GSTTRVLVREVGPSVTVSAVVFADGAPRALGYIWTPKTPRRPAGVRGIESIALLVHRRQRNSRKSGRQTAQLPSAAQLPKPPYYAKCRTSPNAIERQMPYG